MSPQDSLTFAAELEAIKAESIGWLPLGEGVYFHHGDTQSSQEPIVIQVVGIPDASMAGMNVLLLT
jgi:hypothetical protein